MLAVLPALGVKANHILTCRLMVYLRTYGHGFEFDRMADACVLATNSEAHRAELGVKVKPLEDATG